MNYQSETQTIETVEEESVPPLEAIGKVIQ